jgi:hypothetical protein
MLEPVDMVAGHNRQTGLAEKMACIPAAFSSSALIRFRPGMTGYFICASISAGEGVFTTKSTKNTEENCAPLASS